MIDPLEKPLNGIAVYNPDLLNNDELRARFTARLPLLEAVVKELMQTTKSSFPQHRLLVGARGMGKTTLLRRIAVAVEDDPKLNKKWLPLTFPEEQYNISKVSDLWLNCLDALGDSLERAGFRGKAEELDNSIAGITDSNEEARGQEAMLLLRSTVSKTGKKMLLLIDNMDIVLERLKKEHWALRKILSTEKDLLIIGASSRAIETAFKYEEAFYDFFRFDELKGLTEEEMNAMLLNLAQATSNNKVAELIDRDPGRFRAFHVLTGGNPRTIVLLFNVLRHGAINDDIRSDLEGLLDRCTPLYKARFEAMPAQLQQVVDGLAVNWHPISAAELTKKLRMDVNATSAALNRLAIQGVVEKVPYPPGSKTGFQISERFFNIWYLMRASRRLRRRLIWLVEFLKIMYSQDQLNELAEKHLNKSGKASSKEKLRHAENAIAYAESLNDGMLRERLEDEAMRTLLSEPGLKKELAGLIEPKDKDERLKNRLALFSKLGKLKKHVLKINLKIKGINQKNLWDMLGGAFFMSLKEKEDTTCLLEKSTKRDAEGKIHEIEEKYALFSKRFRDAKLMSILKKCVVLGDMTNIYDLEGAKKSAQKHNNIDIHAVAIGASFESLEKENLENIESLRNELENLQINLAYPWYKLGNLLIDNLRRYDEAERAYRKAIKLDSGHPAPWNNLGNLLQEHLHRYKEAEEAYRKAIELDDKYASPWNGLGNLLTYNLHRYKEAEKAYRKGLEVDSTFSFLNFNFAVFLLDRERNYESIVYIQRFVENATPEFIERYWRNVLEVCKKCAEKGIALEVAKIVGKSGMDEKWAPLREALYSIGEKDENRLKRMAPEMRKPAEQLVEEIAPGFFDKE